MSKSKGSWWSNRHRKYKYQDKRDGLEYDLTLDQAKALMSLPCFYCTVPECRGLDRLDNKFGHTLSNVVPCCGKCNLILGSVPYVAKLEMRESLRNIREKKLIDDWTPPYLCEPKLVATKPNRVPANPPPRYDEVYMEGAAWLDSLADGVSTLSALESTVSEYVQDDVDVKILSDICESNPPRYDEVYVDGTTFFGKDREK